MGALQGLISPNVSKRVYFFEDLVCGGANFYTKRLSIGYRNSIQGGGARGVSPRSSLQIIFFRKIATPGGGTPRRIVCKIGYFR